ncbi:Hypothetical protein CINCED_3A005912 [Cinara cedri]|uniref:Uncharacterized protein n=1 Tax=Cinara cedri TaxID=506608 RepID=A0A5E4N6D2_9HEMI|nr:Hypothetical protein CINCED_3A005912 [Cinara cedri]
MAENTEQFEENLISSLRHCRKVSRKLKQITINLADLNFKNQIDVIYYEENVDLSIKNILDDVQNIRSNLSAIENTDDDSFDKTAFNLEEKLQEFQSIINIVSKNKNTIFSHRTLL